LHLQTLQTYIARAAGTHTSIIDYMSLSHQQQEWPVNQYTLLLRALQTW